MEEQKGSTEWQELADAFHEIERNIERVVQGKHREIRLALVSLIAEGHLLIEDVPGVGKTMLAKALARSIDCSFRRIQFTPDLLPTDVTGVNVFNQERGDFEFKPGAIFANIVIGDEINRASPKTQSALLESMEERQVTVDTETYQLGTPFIVIATQNPVEHEGTYPLPEAQLDRFMMRIAIGYPSTDVEAEILATHGGRLHARGHLPRDRRARRGRDDPPEPAGARRSGGSPLHRRHRGRVAEAPGRVPRREPAGVDHAPARRTRVRGRRGARLRHPRRREDAREAGALPPSDRDRRRRDERPLRRRRSERAPPRGDGSGQRKDLMLSTRGFLVIGAGLSLWIVARVAGSPTLHIVAVGLVLLPLVALLFARRGRTRVTIRRRLSDGRATPGQRVTVEIDVHNQASTATSFLLVEDRAPTTLGRRRTWCSPASPATDGSASPTRSCRTRAAAT
jgi:hypothetical protein